MDCRIINEETIAQIKSLWSYCFEKEGSPFYEWYFSKYCLKQNKVIGGFDAEGKLISMLHLNPYHIDLRGKAVKAPYIVGVATDPVARGQRRMGDLLTTTFQLLRAARSPIALLMPIYAGIYQPYGFAYTYWRHAYQLSLRDFRVDHGYRQICRLERVPVLEASKALEAIYKQAMQPYQGCALRDARIWENLLQVASAEEQECVLAYNENNEPCGYVLYKQVQQELQVQELMAINGPAKKELLQYLRGFAQLETLKWLAPPDDLTYLDFSNQQLSGSVEPFMMSRIINTEQVLRDYTPPVGVKEGSLVLAVPDDFFPINTLYTKLSITATGLTLQDTVEEPAIIMDISTMTQLIFGTYTVSQLEREGKIVCHQPEAKLLLESLFPATNNYINEYF